MPGALQLIASRANPRVKQLRAAFADNPRLAAGSVAIEGETLLREAIRSGLQPRTVFLSAEYPTPPWLPAGTEMLRLANPVFASAIDTESPRGIAALIEPSAWTLDAVLAAATGPALLLVAAGLQDPGNLGTLIRSAEAFGATAILTTPNTVSPWNAKALRASAGSVFRLPVVPIPITALDSLRRLGIRLAAAVAPDHSAHSPSVPIANFDLTAPCALLIGNEGRGLAPELLALADARISIPTPGPVESLNAAVAGSLLLYEAARQRAATNH